MEKLTQREQKIIGIFLVKGKLPSSDVHQEIIKTGEDISLVTIKRILSQMADKNLLSVLGAGRSTVYDLTSKSRVFVEIDAKKYIAIEPDKRYGLHNYNFDLFKTFPLDIFTDDELKILEASTLEYKKRTKDLSKTIRKRELERLIIELSWKSSKIEGNTYTLLDTERLILENKKASGHSKEEAQMILNHKDAFNYIYQNSVQFKTITKRNLQELHAILVKDLGVGQEFRSRPVGVTGSIYRPLDNIYQITEAIDELLAIVSKTFIPYTKALIALLGISYIQPFEDGNKRTARLLANALLFSHSLAPLSYRSVDEEEYRSATLVFYELNSIVAMKNIFIDQYKFASQNYAIK